MNAKKELLDLLINNNLTIKCANIETQSDQYDFNTEEYVSCGRKCNLKVNYTPEEYNSFIESLDFEYYDGYGGQELFGTVWLTDGTWLGRNEYDGSEWWSHYFLPTIPNYLQ